jgi:hypothetical protein
MFVDNEVTKKFEGEEMYDKFAIASTMFDVSCKAALLGKKFTKGAAFLLVRASRYIHNLSEKLETNLFY